MNNSNGKLNLTFLTEKARGSPVVFFWDLMGAVETCPEIHLVSGWVKSSPKCQAASGRSNFNIFWNGGTLDKNYPTCGSKTFDIGLTSLTGYILLSLQLSSECHDASATGLPWGCMIWYGVLLIDYEDFKDGQVANQNLRFVEVMLRGIYLQWQQNSYVVNCQHPIKTIILVWTPKQLEVIEWQVMHSHNWFRLWLLFMERNPELVTSQWI